MLGRFYDLDFNIFKIHHRADGGDFTVFFRNPTAERVGIAVFVFKFLFVQLEEGIEFALAVDPIFALGNLTVEHFLFVVLVPDLAHELFQDIFQRDDPDQAAVFVRYRRHMDLLLLKLL